MVSLPFDTSTAEITAIPTSYAQQRLWFLDQWQPNSPLYNVPLAVKLAGPLHLPALNQSLQQLLARHEILRTTFVSRNGHPLQLIAPTLSLSLPLLDLSLLPTDQASLTARLLANQHAQLPFDLAHGPLLRATLLRLAQEEHVLLLCLHHIVTDGWSSGILFHDLSSLYQAALQGEPASLSPLPIQYADYAIWQREWLQGERLERQLHYWREQLADLPVLDLPTDHPRPPQQTYCGATHAFRLPLALLEGLQELSRQEGVTLFMTLLAAFQTLLARYSGQRDIVVGTSIANRNRPELEPLIGCFINMLVLRSDLSGDPSFRQLLARVRQVCLEAYAHQDLPFEYLVESLQPERDLSRPPLIQAILVLQNTPSPVKQLHGLHLQPLEGQAEHTTAKFDLSLSVTQDAQGLWGTLEYSLDLFAAATIERLVSHWHRLLAGIVAQPDLRLSDLPLFTETEHQQLLFEWNSPSISPTFEQTLHQLFEAQALCTPEAVALVFEEEHLTYGELNTRANQLAHYLQALEVGPEVRVGLCLQRCPLLLIGLLGILKAGGAYIPLDPSYPTERLGFMLADSQMALLLTQSDLVEQLPSQSASIVCLDLSWQYLAQLPVTPLQQIDSGHVAYVLYTSGSTGKPKGVAIEHHNACAFLHWASQTFSASELARTLAATSICFDLSIFELFAPLLCAGTCILAENILELPIHMGVTLLNTVPSVMAELLNSSQLPPSVQVVNLAGEALSKSLVTQLYYQPSIQRVLNLYGPTEATTYSTFASISKENSQTIPIGFPIANTQVYLLDQSQHLVPVGIPGELYLGGAGLARGYINRPELTAERFVPNPFSQHSGARLYRTGDLARYQAGGRLEYLGRIDHQVKVRGFRIELGEIETVLAQHPSIQDVIVVLREDAPGDKRIVAYLVPQPNQPTLTGTQWRQYVQQHLPQHMVPATFVTLETLPLTPNGKVNRQALPPPEKSRLPIESTYLPPQTPTQQLLVNIWQQVLHVERIGIQDNFFALGGHSLLATQVRARVRNIFKLALPLQTFFEAPTIALLARQIDTAQYLQQEQLAHDIELRACLHEDAVSLSFAQQRLWFLDQWQPNSPLYNVPLAVKLTGPLHLPALNQSLQQLLARHEILRTTFVSRNGQPLQLMAPTLSLSLPLLDLSLLPTDQASLTARLLANQHAQLPFDLARGPLLRATLLRLAQEEHVLLLCLHHIVTDGWSSGILFHDLSSLYQAVLQGEPASLSPLPIQYADYAIWQREWLQGERLERQLYYWREQLADLPVLDLPTDHPRPPQQTYRGATHAFRLPLALLEGLQELSRQEGVTLFMTLLAAFQTLLARYSGQRDIVVGTSIANRNRPELELLMGCFMNTLILRSDLSGDPSFRQLLKRVRQVCLDAYAHQALPFEYLVEALNPVRDLSHNALYQVLFELENIPVPMQPSSSQLAMVPATHDTSLVKVDLTVRMAETQRGLVGWIMYNTDLFDQVTIERMAQHYQTLLEGIVSNISQPLWELPLLTQTEWTELLYARNDTASDYPRDRCFHQLFEEQVLRVPDAIAAVYEEQHLTYRELDQRANVLANYLQMHGVTLQTCVGLCMKRSLDLIVSLLGIFKAGSAFLPLDPDFPQERMAFMLQDAQATLLLTQKSLVPHLPTTDIPVLCLDDQWGLISEAEQCHTLPSQVTAQHLAYIIYTSGSTGKPKGVLIHHQGFLNYLIWCMQAFGAASGRGAPVQSTIAADAIFPCLFSPLLVGTCVTLLPESFALEALGSVLQTHKNFSMVKVTPSQLETLIPQLPATDANDWICQLIIGAEALRGDLLTYWQQHAPETILLNEYGPTETVVGCSAYQIPQGQRISGAVPIGLPIANTQFFVLDAHLQPVPIGVPGELFIGGDGLAWGYLNRPDLTATAFIPNPFVGTGFVPLQPGSRLYRTGDLVRYLPDRAGNIEFLGRLDHQVKIRGFRIELGEIEEALVEHPIVRECIVIAREDQPGTQQLVAYVIMDSVNTMEQELLTNTLHNYLKEKLPEYMLPTAFIALDTLPLTTNGKVDRRALPAPDALHPELRLTFVAPQSPVEQVLAGIWASVLGLEQVGIYDNFFELGGHSLLAIRIVVDVRETLLVELPLRHLFERPTIAGMAEILLQDSAEREQVEKTAQIFLELANLSDAEVEALIKHDEER